MYNYYINEEKVIIMDKRKQIIAEVVSRLKVIYPDAVCALEWGGGEENAWKLLVMGRLSAQCTDEIGRASCRERVSLCV